MDNAARAMTAINANLWLGHFDIRPGGTVPCFRHTSLFRGMTHGSGADHLEDLVDIALSECERYYPAFSLLSRSSTAADSAALALAMTLAMARICACTSANRSFCFVADGKPQAG